MDPDLQRRSHRGRGQANVLGLVLLMGLVVMISMALVVVGAQSLDDARESSQTEDAAISFSEFQSEAAELSPDGESTYSIAFGESSGASTGPAPGASVEGGAEGNPRVDPTAGSITITGPGGTIVSDDLGVIEYERGDQVLAYQGGGVFRGNVHGEEAVVSSPPPFDYQFKSGEPTLSIPIRTLSTDTGDVLTGDRFELRASSSKRQYPAGSSDTNPLDSGQSVTLEIQSDYYLAWGDLFEDRTNADPVYDHPNDIVEVTLDAETEIPDVEGALAGAPASGNVLNFNHKVDFETYHSTGSPSGDMTTWVRGSFDASSGPDAGKGTVEGDLVVQDWLAVESTTNSDPFGVTGETIVGGDPSTPTDVDCRCDFGGDWHVTEELRLSGHGGEDLEIDGDVYVDGDVTSLNGVTIDGNLHVDGDLTASSSASTITGDVIVSGASPDWSTDGSDPDAPKTPSFPPNDPVSLEIEQRGEDWEDENDNPGDGTIDDIEASGGCSSTCTLTEGNYYVDDAMRLHSGETLKFDTSGGAVEIYVDDRVEIDGGSIEVDGDNPVLLFNDGRFDFIEGDVQTSPDADHAPAFWTYMHPDRDVTFGDSGFVGVIYAPGADGGELSMSQHVVVKGAIVAELDPVIEKHSEIHFDEALLAENPDPGGLAGRTVGFLQISTTDIEVSAD